MNSISDNRVHHQRVEAAFSGRWADRVAVCEHAFASSVATEMFGRPMHTGSTELHFQEALALLDGDAAHTEFLDRAYQDTLALHRRMDWDIFYAPWRNEWRPTKRLDEHTILYDDATGSDWEIWRFSTDSHTYGKIESSRPPMDCDQVCAQLREQVRLGWEKATPPWIDRLNIRALKELGAEFVVGVPMGMAVPMEPGWLEATAVEPQLMADYFDLHVQRMFSEIDFWRERGARLIDFGGDFAFNSGPIYSPRFFETVMAPRWKKLYDRCRELGLWCIQRSDGNLWPVAQTLFGWARPHAYYECDYDAGMRFDELRRAFPELVLIGNVSSDLLVRGTPEQIRNQTRQCIEQAAPRVVVASANAVLHSTPVENVLAMHDAVKRP
jgi:hypothetical protein